MKIIKLMNFIDKISEWTGVVISWLVIPLTAVVFYEVLLRYVFNNPTDWVYDTAWMIYSTLFLIGGAYTLLHQRHVRIDILFNHFYTDKGRRIFNIIFYAVIFIPTMVVFTIKGIEFATKAWVVGEKLSTTVWFFPAGPIKTVIPIGFMLMSLQGVAELIRSLIIFKKGERL